MLPVVKIALANIDDQMSLAEEEVETFINGSFDLSSSSFQNFELEITERYRKIAALRIARQLQEVIISEKTETTLNDFMKTLKGKFRFVSWRPHQVKFLGGLKITIWMPYYARKCAPQKGITPHMILVGIMQHLSPAFASAVGLLSAALSSYVEAAGVLKKFVMDLDVKTIRTVTKAFAINARVGQEAFDKNPEKARLLGKSTETEKIERIVVSTDGGRIRIRKKKKGKKGKGGKDRYDAQWREPRLIIIVSVDEQGRQKSSFSPIIDATMGGPNTAFSLIKFYLKQFSLKDTKISFVSDGAKWIWNRVNNLFNNLGIENVEVIYVLDYYHASQHLSSMIAAKTTWKEPKRKSWVKKMKKWLLEGKIQDVIQDMEQITKGTRNKTLKKELKYFKSHIQHMDYKNVREKGLPIGSGTVESAIRRVINLRLKGPGIIWNLDGAEEMLLLRSFFKAGRWNQLENWAFTPESYDI